MTMAFASEQIAALAQQYGFTSGVDAENSQIGLWTKDNTDGGRVTVYPYRDGWMVASYDQGARFPHSGKLFDDVDIAFRYATQ
jgi:hypothetical protein